MVIAVHVDFSSSDNPSLRRLSFRVPQFFTSSGNPYSVENLYLCTIARRLKEKSVKTVSEHVKELLLWREGLGRDLLDFSDSDLEYFIDSQCSYITPFGRRLSWNTVNSRVSGAHRFLVWCKLKGFNLNITLEKSSSSAASTRVTYKIKGHPSRKFKEPVKFLLLDVALKFIRAIEDASGESLYLRTRNSLMAKLMLQSGLRLSEVVDFPLIDLPEIITGGVLTPARIVGKGGKRRVILIPNRLLSDLWLYVDIQRQKLIDDLGAGYSSSSDDVRLFIGRRGSGVTGNWLEKIFSRAGKLIEVKAVPHALRHTFGTYHYLYNKDILLLSQLMGHEKTETTEQFYVHLAKLIAHSGNYEDFQREVDAMCSVIE